MRAFVRDHGAELKAELERRRIAAKRAVVQASDGGMPVTHSEWVTWFAEHADEFAERMKTASHRRREANRRLAPAADLPAAVRRLEPVSARPNVRQLSPLLQLLWGRSGWFIVEEGADVHHLFLLTFAGRTHCFQASGMRVGRELLLDADGMKDFASLIAPLEETIGSGEGRAFEVIMRGMANSQRLFLRVVRARQLQAPVKSAHKRQKTAGPAGDGAESGSALDSDVAALDEIEQDIASDSSSSHVSVDTDVDSGLDDDLVIPKSKPAEEAIVSD